MTTTVIETPDTTAVMAEQTEIVAFKLNVVDAESHGAAMTFIQRCRAATKRIIDAFAESKSLANKAHKAITTLESSLLRPIEEARAGAERSASAYEREARRIADEKSRAAAEVARKAQEEQNIRDAVAAEASGDTATADAILDEPIAVPVVTVAPEVSKVSGVSSTLRWHAEVTNKHALIQYVAAHPEWIGFLDVNMPSLNGIAKSQKDAMSIPGVRAVSEIGYSARAQ